MPVGIGNGHVTGNETGNIEMNGSRTYENGKNQNYLHYPTAATATSAGSKKNSKKRKRKGRNYYQILTLHRRRNIPWASIIALLVTWIGLFLFTTKLFVGMKDLEDQSQGLFKFLIPYLQGVRQAVVILAIIMASLTLMMAVVGFFATLHCDKCYRGKLASCMCSKLGSRTMCGLFWAFSYLMNLCWMFILSLMVVMTSAYFATLPVCLPQSGNEEFYCLNFTILASMMGGGGKPDPNAVNLLLCGGAVDKLCKLTKALFPWYWGAYLGCLAVLLGLSHFNASLSANFAHGKHAVRYVKIRDRTASTVEWTKDWKVKSLTYFDLSSNSESTVSFRKKSLKCPSNSTYTLETESPTTISAPVNNQVQNYSNGKIPNGNGSLKSKRRGSNSTTCSEQGNSDSEYVDAEKGETKIDLKSSNGSIILTLKNLGNVRTLRPHTLLVPPPLPTDYSPSTVNGDLQRMQPPPYQPRSNSGLSISNGSVNYTSTPLQRPRRLSYAEITAIEPQNISSNSQKEIRV